MRMWNLGEEAIRSLAQLPETGMGFQLVEAMMASQAKPAGLPIRCPQCFSFYSVHLTEPRMRCPVCNTRLFFPAQ